MNFLYGELRRLSPGLFVEAASCRFNAAECRIHIWDHGMKLVTLQLLLAFAFACQAGADVVKLKDSGEQPVAGEESRVRRSIILANANAEFDINYCASKNHDELFGDPHVSQISINHLYNAPWFTFNVRGGGKNGLNLARQPFKIEPLQTQVDRKGIRIVWDLPTGKVELVLLLNANDNKLYGRFRVNTTGTLTIALSLAPGGYCPTSNDRDRWVFTGKKDEPHGSQKLDVGSSGFLSLYDKKLDPENSKGMGAAGYVWGAPSDTKVAFACGEYTSSLNAEFSAATGSYYFIFWPFTKVGNEEAKQMIAKEGDALAGKLATEADKLFDVAQKIQIRKPAVR